MSAEGAQAVVEDAAEVTPAAAPQEIPPVQTVEAAAPAEMPVPLAVDITEAVRQLPAGMQQRLVEIVVSGGGVVEVIRGFEEALPQFLRSPSAPTQAVGASQRRSLFYRRSRQSVRRGSRGDGKATTSAQRPPSRAARPCGGLVPSFNINMKGKRNG
jgi:hypothetical protein